MKIKTIEYIKWQNRATQFYLASRLLALRKLGFPAAFCGQQALELLLKATLIYWDESFDPKKARHNFPKMIGIMKNKVPDSANVNIPKYFYWNNRYQEVSRYPSEEAGGIFIPAAFLNDLDKTFYALIVLVPFRMHTNSELWNIINRNEPHLKILRKENEQVRELRKFLAYPKNKGPRI